MTPLGKSLVFYLKYPAEMKHLYKKPEYDGEEPDLTGLEDAERVKKMARTVGAAAYQEAADFLLECAKKIEDHFTGLRNVTLAKRARRSRVLRNWEWKVIVRATSVRAGWVQCGVSLRDQEKILVPWLWRQGGRAWEEAVMERLGSRVHSRAGGGVVSDSGSVALACIPVFAGNEPDLDVDRDALIAKVVGAFSVIQADDVEAISRQVNEEDDSLEPDEADPDAE